VSWTVYGRTPLDFTVWILILDGMQVEGFDKHSGGSGELRDLGMRPDLWHGWVCDAIQSYQEWHAARGSVADSIRSSSPGGFTKSRRSESEAHKFLESRPIPASTWKGESRIAMRLETLWRDFEKTQSSHSGLPDDWQVVLNVPNPSGLAREYPTMHLYLTNYPGMAVHICRPASALVSLGTRSSADRPFGSVEAFTEMTDLVEIKLRV
jgi:hypothetical protein